MRKHDKIHAAAIACWLAVVLLTATAFSAEALPAPQVEINTNTVNAIVSAVENVGTETPASLFSKLPDIIQFYGVVSITEAGSASGGAAAMCSVLKFSVVQGAVQVDVGPAYTVGLDANDDVFHAIELAVSTQFPAAGRMQERFAATLEGVPVLDLLPRYIHVQDMKAFVGAGATLGGSGDWTPTGWIASAGINGIRIGK